MRIYMQSPPGAPDAGKYVQLVLHQDLLGGWSLVRETGQQGSRPTVRREQFLNVEEAQQAFIRARDQAVKKGLKVMFSQGAEEPPGVRQHVA